MSNCKFCSAEIFWILINGIWRPFEDRAGRTPHKCTMYENTKSTIQKQILELVERIQIEHNLTLKLISIVHDLEKRFDSI